MYQIRKSTFAFSSSYCTPMSRLEGPIKTNSLSADNQIQSSVD
jgi:hypothetical protein